jgi:hypothetical protein
MGPDWEDAGRGMDGGRRRRRGKEEGGGCDTEIGAVGLIGFAGNASHSLRGRPSLPPSPLPFLHPSFSLPPRPSIRSTTRASARS